ncbi:MAG: dihydroorotate dehydrogenase [Bacillota bacterium]|nr:dihydroorotate dehydrogenase [Bacillota bacterium]MDW7730256.1 dihydroorotate dehydrogenase [Bacillota bacterium]
MNIPNASVNLGGIELDTPVLAASGPFGHGREFEVLLDFSSLGGIIAKGVSLEPWPGNPPPRITETASGLLNAVGLHNPGMKKFVEDDLPLLRELGPKIIVNIIGKNVRDYASVAAGLNGVEGISGLEVNVSCPNLKAGGLSFGTDPDLTYCVVAAVRRETALPLLVKLTPNVNDIVAVARAAEEAGADVISLINTLSGMIIDIEKKKPFLGNRFGGLSGPAIMPVALRMVWQVSEAVQIPVLGMGGITSASDAIQFILAGARAVAVGSGLFYDPDLPAKITEGILAYMSRHKVTSLSELEGLARTGGDKVEV